MPIIIPSKYRVSRNIPPRVLRRIWAMPCVICGSDFNIQADHITPWSMGGTNDESNLQPLCRICNAKKSHRLNNDDLAKWFQENREHHELRTRYEREFQYTNIYDRMDFSDWVKAGECQ